MSGRRRSVAVCGGASGSPALMAAAEALGAALVDAGHRVLTGGLGGVMAAASKGARQAQGWEEGRVVAVLPGEDPAAANPWADVVVATGIGRARNLVLIHSADAVVAVGGGAGTLSELALAWQHGKPVVALDLGEGWSARLAGQAVDGRRTDVIGRATSVDEVVGLLAQVFAAAP